MESSPQATVAVRCQRARSARGDDLELSYHGAMDVVSGTLCCGHNAGFFSNCTVTLWNLAEVLQAGQPWPQRIDFSRAFSAYRSPLGEGADLYPVFFEPPRTAMPDGRRRLPRVKHHGLYRFVPYGSLAPIMEHYFRPSVAVRSLEQHLIERHGIDLARTIAVVYRGTDKVAEVRLAEPEAYLAQTRTLLARHPAHRVLIQTDERAVRDLFCETFGDRCFFLPEMPVSGGGIAVHDLADEALQMHRTDFGALLVAVTHLLSRAAIVVNHTGNMALWICLWRGHCRGVEQFDDTGGFVDLRSAAYYQRRLAHTLRRACRKLGLSTS